MKDFLLTMLALFALVLVLGALLAGLLAGNRTSHDTEMRDSALEYNREVARWYKTHRQEVMPLQAEALKWRAINDRSEALARERFVRELDAQRDPFLTPPQVIDYEGEVNRALTAPARRELGPGR